MPPKTKLEKETLIRTLLQHQISYIGRSDLTNILDMNEKSLQTWELECNGEFPIEAYFLATGPVKTIIYPVVSVLEYVTGTERTRRILEEEGYTSV